MKQKTACLGLFSAVAIILGYVESLVPVFAGIPGIKLGLANLGYPTSSVHYNTEFIIM